MLSWPLCLQISSLIFFSSSLGSSSGVFMLSTLVGLCLATPANLFLLLALWKLRLQVLLCWFRVVRFHLTCKCASAFLLKPHSVKADGKQAFVASYCFHTARGGQLCLTCSLPGPESWGLLFKKIKKYASKYGSWSCCATWVRWYGFFPYKHRTPGQSVFGFQDP